MTFDIEKRLREIGVKVKVEETGSSQMFHGMGLGNPNSDVLLDSHQMFLMAFPFSSTDCVCS